MESWKINLKDNWNEIKGKIKQEYPDLIHDDLSYEEGMAKELAGQTQKKTGKTKDEVKEWIEGL